MRDLVPLPTVSVEGTCGHRLIACGVTCLVVGDSLLGTIGGTGCPGIKLTELDNQLNLDVQLLYGHGRSADSPPPMSRYPVPGGQTPSHRLLL